MELNSFITFETLMTEAKARKETLGLEINYLKKIVADKMAVFDQQVESGQDPDDLHEVMDALKKKIDNRSEEWHTWDSSISGKDNTSLIYQAAQDVLKEGAEIINKELRQEWKSRIAELEGAKAAYLALCTQLGSIQRRAEEISNKLSSLEGFLPTVGVPRLVTGIDLEESAGAIFLDYNAIKKAFLGGGR
jgi:chromosome segregation ATPase